MTDLNTMMREQAMNSLQGQLDTAVTNGDTEAARKITDDIAKLAVQTAPKAPPYGEVEIRAEMDKLDWFGVDPKKSARALELGKSLNPKKFSTAAEFAAAVVKAVEDDAKPANSAAASDDEEEDDAVEEEEEDTKPQRKQRRTDGPGESDANQRSAARGRGGPWKALSDAPADVQEAIKKSADKFVPAGAKKEIRDGYIARALDAQYKRHQASKGKK